MTGRQCVGDPQTLQQTHSTRKCKLRSKFWWLADRAIRITYRISLRSSSLWEPRHPLLKVVRHLGFGQFKLWTQDHSSLFSMLDLSFGFMIHSVHLRYLTVYIKYSVWFKVSKETLCCLGGSTSLQTDAYSKCQQSHLAFQIHKKGKVDTDSL